MFNITEENPKAPSFRHQIDTSSGILYLSIVDIIEMLNISSDARNYWKALKNRLNKTQNKLVTKCNQLKMPASDGKMYLTDVTDPDNMLLLIQHLAPERVAEFRRIFRETYTEILENTPSSISNFSELSTEESNDSEIGIDVYQDKNIYIIRAMLAGIESENISIIANCQNILIKGSRTRQNLVHDDYQIEELSWGKFSRNITLPEEIEVEEIETKYTHGMLEIKLPIIDKSKTKIIKIK